MKFTLEQRDLLAPLRHVYGVAHHHDPELDQARQRARILTHTLIEARRGADGQDGTIAFDACDDEVLYESERLDGTVEEEGKATVEAHLLHDLVKRIPSDATVRVRLERKTDSDADGGVPEPEEARVPAFRNWVVFEADGSTFELPSMAPGDFQEFAEPTGAAVRLPAAGLRRLIDSCRIAMSNDDARLHLNGIFLHTTTEDGRALFRAAATDGHRLACSMHVLAGDGDAIRDGITLPRKAVEQVNGLLRGARDEVELRSGDDLVQIRVGSVSMTARLSQGGFPDYQSVIPQDRANRLRVPRAALEQAIDRVSAVARKNPGIVLQMGDGDLRVSAGDPATGLGEERIRADYEGEPLTIGFNSRYVLACCRVIPDRELLLEFNTPGHAAVIRGPGDDGTVHVVMPMDVSGQRHGALLQDAGADAGARFTLGRSPLLAPLARLQGVVERVGTRPILSHALIRAGLDGVTFDACDSQALYESERLPARVETAGAATVEVQLLHGVISKLPEDVDVRVSGTPVDEAGAPESGAWLRVEAGASRFLLPSLAPAAFPALHDLEWEHRFEVSAAELGRMLAWCRIAMSDDPARMHLNGVLLHVTEEDGRRLLRMGATDGHRLSQAGCACPPGAEALTDGVTVPRKAVEQAGRLLADADGGVQVAIGNGWMRFGIADVAVVTRLHESRFPDYQRVIPTEYSSTLTINAARLRQALERLALVANRRSRAIRFELSEERLAAVAGDRQHGVGRETLISGAFRGSPIVVGFRSEYVIEFCRVARSDEVVMEFQGSGQPVVIRDPGGLGRLHVILPTRV